MRFKLGDRVTRFNEFLGRKISGEIVKCVLETTDQGTFEYYDYLGDADLFHQDFRGVGFRLFQRVSGADLNMVK